MRKEGVYDPQKSATKTDFSNEYIHCSYEVGMLVWTYIIKVIRTNSSEQGTKTIKSTPTRYLNICLISLQNEHHSVQMLFHMQGICGAEALDFSECMDCRTNDSIWQSQPAKYTHQTFTFCCCNKS